MRERRFEARLAREKRDRTVTGDTPEREPPKQPHHSSPTQPTVEGAVGGIERPQ